MKNLIFAIKPLFSITVFTLLSIDALAHGTVEKKSIFDLMNHREVLELTLKTDLTALRTDRHSESSHKAKVSFKDANGNTQQWDLKVKLRGAFRRIKCSDVPPLKLNFKKSELEAAGLSLFDDLKLVPQCAADEAAAKEALLREYLAYRLFNEITDYSYRVQLLRIIYKDSATGKKDKQWAFLIEDTAQLRARTGSEKYEAQFNLPVDSFHLSQARTVAFFEYLIGNGDWGFDKVKNVKFLKKKGRIIPVPYDFDFSGFVNAPYAVPNSNIGQTSIEERIYLGFKEDEANFHGTIYNLVGKRSKLEETVMHFRPLSYEARLEIVTYLSGFFEQPEQINEVWAVDDVGLGTADK